jgi:hypothetical protein
MTSTYQLKERRSGHGCPAMHAQVWRSYLRKVRYCVTICLNALLLTNPMCLAIHPLLPLASPVLPSWLFTCFRHEEGE